MTPQEYVQLTEKPAPTKIDEYKRSVELFEEIYKEKGLYFALALLYDSQYENKDLLGMLEVLKPGKGKLSDISKNK